MIRSTLIHRVVAKTINKQARKQTGGLDRGYVRLLTKQVVMDTFDEILDAMQHGEQVSIIGFGKFFPHLCPEKHVRSGLSKNHYMLPERLQIRFRSSEAANRNLNSLSSMVKKIQATSRKKAAIASA